MLHLQGIVGHALNRLGDTVPVRRFPAQSAQNQHVERAVNQFDPVCFSLCGHVVAVLPHLEVAGLLLY